MKSLKIFACALIYSAASSSIALAADVLPKETRDKVKGELVWHDASGGATTRARDDTTNKDFTAETGITLKSDFNSDTTKFFAAEDSGAQIPWSLIEFPTKGDFIRARDAGYVEKLDPSIVDFSKLDKDAHDDYGVDVMRYGIVLTYNTEKFSGANAPTGLRDLYDLAKFPGKRCMFKYPQFGAVLESALLADGVTRDKLYPLDLDKAFAKLDLRKREVVGQAAGRHADDVETDEQFAKQMRHAGDGGAASHGQRPFAVDRGVEIGLEPINPRKVRELLGHFVEPLVRDDTDHAGRERDHVMVQPLERVAVEVREIAGHVQLRILPLSARQVLGTRHPAAEQHQAFVKSISGANDDLVGRQLDRPRHETADELLFLRADVIAPTQLLKVEIDHTRLSGRPGEAATGRERFGN